MRSQDATLHRQVSRIKTSIEDITLEIEAMTRPRLAWPLEARRAVTNGDWRARKQPKSPSTTTQQVQRLHDLETRKHLVSPRQPLHRGMSQFYEPLAWDEGTPATLARERSSSEATPKLSGSSGSVNSIASSSSRLSSDAQPMSPPLAPLDNDKDQDDTHSPTSPRLKRRKSIREISGRRLSRAFSSFRKARVGRWLLRRFSPTDQIDLTLPGSGTETNSTTIWLNCVNTMKQQYVTGPRWSTLQVCTVSWTPSNNLLELCTIIDQIYGHSAGGSHCKYHCFSITWERFLYSCMFTFQLVCSNRIVLL